MQTSAFASFRRRYFGNAAFYRMVFTVAVPIMIQNGITNFVNLLDNIMVGSVGTLQMSGVGIANQMMFILNLSLFGAISGAGIFGAQFYGKGDHNGVRYAFRFKLYISAFLMIVGLTLFTLFNKQIISLYLTGEGSDADRAATLGYAQEYLRVVMIGYIPFVLTQCYAGTLRETGETFLPMIAGIVSITVNLVLNAVLIYGLLGFPALGIIGAAIATNVARFVEAAIVMIWTHRHKQRNQFIVGVYRSPHIPGKLAGNIFRKTIPLMMNETLWACGIALLSVCYSMHGLDVIPANTMASTINNVFNVALIAMGSAVGIIVGQLLGAGKTEEAVDTDRKLLTFSVLMCVVVGGIMALLSPYIPLIYNTTDSVRQLAASFILISALFMPNNSLCNACYFTLRSGGKTFVTFLFDSCFVCGITVPMAFLLTTYTGITIIPLYIACTAIDIVKSVIGLWMIKKGLWIHNITA